MTRIGLLAALALACSTAGADTDTTTVTVNATHVTHKISNLTLGCHSDSGYTHQPRGLYAQLVYGESFEAKLPTTTAEAKAGFPVGGRFSIQPAGDKHGNRLRHCSYQLFSTPAGGPDDDFHFDAVAGLDGAAATVSFRSANFDSKFIQAVPAGTSGVEAGRLGISEVQGGSDDINAKKAASWQLSGGSRNPDGDLIGVKIVNVLTGQPMGLNGMLSGDCAKNYHGSAGASDVVLVAAQQSLQQAQVLFNLVTPPPPPLIWRNATRGAGVVASFAVDQAAPFHGLASQRIEFASGTGVAGVVNRGLGAEGLFLEAGKPYEGYFFARSAEAVTLTVELQLKESGTPIAGTTIPFGGGGGGGSNWTRVDFTLTPTQGTPCVGVDPASPEAESIDCGKMGPGAGHVCVSCGGQVMVGLAGPGTVNIDYVYLSAGKWGRFGDLPVLKSAVDALQGMGVSIIRQGGSFTDPADYFWKRWRGAPWDRPSLGWEWGQSLVSGWGPFEMIDLCNAAGIEPVMTTTGQAGTACCSPDDMADLVEYAWGNASTAWGRKRIVEDQHPDPYRLHYIELGNEQYNTDYVDQVAAMEARAKEVGKGGELYYLFPNNGKWLNDADGAKAEKLGLGTHLLSDIHLGGGGGVEISRKQFAAHPTWTEGTANAETNMGIHTMRRALAEASDLNDWYGAADVHERMIFRTASFCNERSGHYDAFDQGLIFFLPNMTWYQPPAHVHAMVKQTWQPNAVVASVAGAAAAGQTVSAQVSDDGKDLVIRYTNSNATPVTVSLDLQGATIRQGAAATVWTLASDDLDGANPPSNPDAIAPVKSILDDASLTVPGQSYTVVEVPLAA